MQIANTLSLALVLGLICALGLSSVLIAFGLVCALGFALYTVNNDPTEMDFVFATAQVAIEARETAPLSIDFAQVAKARFVARMQASKARVKAQKALADKEYRISLFEQKINQILAVA